MSFESGETILKQQNWDFFQFGLFCRDGAEFECIYAAYCYEVNQQAKLGGMASSVAKINSVGLRLALKDLPSSETIPALISSVMTFQDLPCDVLFPSCDIGFTKVEKN